MISTHEYTAVLQPDGAALSVLGGQVSFDAGRSPHVQGSLTVTAVPGVVEGLDPRESPRVTLTATATSNGVVQSRVFDLGVRSRQKPAADGTVTIELASDEAILDAVRTLTDDPSPLLHQDSLYALVDGILGGVLAAALDRAASAADVPVPALAASSNLIRNPRAGENLTDWGATWAAGAMALTRYPAGGPAYAASYATALATAATTGAYVFIDNAVVSVTPGKLYELSVDVLCNYAVSLDAILYGASGIVAFATPTPITPGAVWRRIVTTFVAPPGATNVRPRVNIANLPAGQYLAFTAWRLAESTGDQEADRTYYDGGTPDTVFYDHAWAQAAHASISTRTPRIDAATPDGLIWRAGQTALEFLRPILQARGLRLVCDEQRVWTLRDEDYTAPGSLTIRHGVNLTGGGDVIDRDSGEWFDGRVTRYKWTTPDGVQREMVDSFALPGAQQIGYLEINAAYPGPGRSEYAVRRAQQRGLEITASRVADWAASAEQPLTVRLDGTPTQTGKTQTVTFDLSTDEVTVTSRTTDTPEHAWILQPAHPWTAGAVGESWKEAP